MKRGFILAILFIVGSAFGDAPVGVQVGTNSVTLLPTRTLKNAPAWSTNTVYAQGAYVEVDMGFYMAIVGGTSSNAVSGKPSHASGEATEGTVTWLKVPRGLRNGLAIVNMSTNEVFLSVDYDAQVDKGISLTRKGSSWSPDMWRYPQGEVKAITESVSNLVTGLEW